MSVDEKLKVLADRIKSHSSAMLTEEAVKTAIVLPFLAALDYDVFNPDEVVPEFTADAVGKRGEKVDYAIKLDGEIRILIECKPITTNLDKTHLAQLYRYFSVTNAKFAILTNGRTFHFHTDLVAPNKLDDPAIPDL
ncbi:type I restriction endonuclease [Tianweitania aestuarii]|uniref:type I restriction endonuclease n=1 Tax=Tianweitania aestuarii TaxID=2814886 RepID=UPI002022D4D7|nr:type I restriction endonuclease [Tianweitania aestuarii]